jgi:hypothetical protein
MKNKPSNQEEGRCKQSSASYLLVLLFDPEDGCSIFL